MNNPIQPALAFVTAIGFFSCIFYLLHWGYPAENKDQLNQLTGVLITIFTLQMNYFFGSTSGSKAKDDTISDIAKMPIAPVAPVAPVAPILPIAPIAPVTIPNATNVMVSTETGDVNIPPKQE